MEQVEREVGVEWGVDGGGGSLAQCPRHRFKHVLAIASPTRSQQMPSIFQKCNSKINSTDYRIWIALGLGLFHLEIFWSGLNKLKP